MLFLVFLYLFRSRNLNLLTIRFLILFSSEKIDPINFNTSLYMRKCVYDVYILFPSSKIFGLGKCGVLYGCE